MDDDTLIAAFYACDNSALTTLVEKYQVRLNGYFERRGLSDDEATSAAQIVWLRLLETKNPPEGRSPTRFDSARGTPFSGWLFAIARNFLTDARRRLAAEPASLASGDDMAEDQNVAVSEESPEAVLIAEEQREATLNAYRACLDTLPEEQRAVVVLELARRELDPIPQQREWATQREIAYARYIRLLNRGRKRLEGGDWQL